MCFQWDSNSLVSYSPDGSTSLGEGNALYTACSPGNKMNWNLELDERLQQDKKRHSDGDNEVDKLPQWSATWI